MFPFDDVIMLRLLQLSEFEKFVGQKQVKFPTTLQHEYDNIFHI